MEDVRRGMRHGAGRARARIALVTCLYVLAQALLPHLHWSAVAGHDAALAALSAASSDATQARLRTAPASDAAHHESGCAICQARAQSASFLPSPAAQLLRIATRSSAVAGADVSLASAESGVKSARGPPHLS